jgi:hypothetical protein
MRDGHDVNRAEQESNLRDDARAEHMCNQTDESGQDENYNSITSSSNTHSTRQSPTIPGAVARYVEILVNNSHMTKVITPCNLETPFGDDSDRAEQQSSHRDGKSQAEPRKKGRAEQ